MESDGLLEAVFAKQHSELLHEIFLRRLPVFGLKVRSGKPNDFRS
jgi:hypothetical protein